MSCDRALLAACTVWIAAACAPSPDPPANGVEQSLRVSVTRVEFGAPFEFEVTRSHGTDYVSSSWPEPAADGLHWSLLDARTRQRAATTVEWRRYRARILSLAPEVTLILPAWSVSARGGGGETIAPAQHHALYVTSVLPASDAGAFELPEDLIGSHRIHWGWWLLLAAASGWAALRMLTARGTRTATPLPPTDAGSLEAELAVRLRELARLDVMDGVTDRALHDEAAAIARAWIGLGGVEATIARTREDLAAAWGERPGAADLAAVFAACEQVQFARVRSTPESRVRTLAALERALGVEG